MNKITKIFDKIHNELIFISLLLFIFIQTINSFITNVYAINFSMMGLGPFALLILFLISPFLLMFFKDRFPLIGSYITLSLLLIARILMIFIANTYALAFITGIGAAAFFMFLPAYIVRKTKSDDSPQYLTITQGLVIAIGVSIALKAIGSSYDFSSYGLGQIISGVFILVVALMIPGMDFGDDQQPVEESSESTDQKVDEITSIDKVDDSSPTKRKRFGRIFLLSMGIYGIIMIEWFALAFPSTFARWSDSSYFIVTILTLISVAVFFILITVRPKLFNGMKLWLIVVLNVALLASIILVAALPQPEYSVVQQIFTYTTAILSPVALIDFLLLTKELHQLKPSPRKLGGAFGLSSLIFLIVSFLMIASFNYEWVPGMGFLRNRFYLLIIILAVIILLPIIFAKGAKGFVGISFKDLPKKLGKRNQIISYVLIGMILAVSATGFGINIVTPETPATPTSLTIMTYNVHQGEDKAGQFNLNRLLTSIKKADPDILALQESEMARICLSNIDLIRFLAENLDMYYFYGPKTVEGTYGVATLSKYPIEFSEVYFMPSLDHSQRVVIRTDLRIGTALLSFYNTHFGLEHEERTPQAEFISDLLSGLTRTIIVGDFNTKDNETEYPIFTSGLLDSWLEINPTGLNSTGFNGDTNRFPRRRIDFILFTPDFTISDVEVLTWAVESDHWPVFAQLVL
ncbi:MAG: endonuclease/exonuclease/phosphatase family protein [Candidatus Heimdallarchaeota archaeon]